MYAGHFDFEVSMIRRVSGLYSSAECFEILDGVRDAEWLPGTVNRSSGREVDRRSRDNLIAIVRDPKIGESLWGRIAPHVPATMTSGWHGPRRTVTACGLFEPLRVYRYEVGHHFGLHSDQSYSRGNAHSLLTLLVYLDEGFEGGQTAFPDEQQSIEPRTGDALWFQHAVLHEGKPVTKGTKHVLRTDVLYR